MITSVISSAARLSLAPARLVGRAAGSVLSGLRGDTAEEAHPAPSASRTKTSSRRRGQAQPKRSASRRGAKAQSKRAASRTGRKAQPKAAASRTRTKAQPKRATQDKPLDDVKIAHDVESTIFQGIQLEQGKVDVNVADGVVRLRGEVRTPDLMSELETRAARVRDVRRVENLLHLEPGDSPARSYERAITRREPSEELSAPPSAVRTRDFGAAKEPGRAPTGSAGEVADPTDRSSAGDAAAEQEGPDAAEQEGPDAAELDKDPAYQPSDPGLRDIKGG